MSLIFCDGVDDALGDLGKWDLVYQFARNIAYSRNGSLGYRSGDQGPRIQRLLGTANEHATITMGCAFKGEGAGAFQRWTTTIGHMSFWSDNGSVQHVQIFLTWDGTNARVAAYRGPGSALLGDAVVSAWVVNQWYYVEAQVVLHDTAGSVIVKINGTTVLNLTGVDTKNGGTKTVIDSVSIANPGVNNGMQYDDIYITNGAGSVNNDFLGDIAVETLYPSGDGSSSQWVGSDGNSINNSLLIDEAAVPDTTDYVQSATAGNRDLYAVVNLTRTSGTIYGLMVSSYAQKSDGGDVSLKNVVKSGVTALASAAKALVTTYLPVSSILETNPDTTTAWTVSDVNGME